MTAVTGRFCRAGPAAAIAAVLLLCSPWHIRPATAAGDWHVDKASVRFRLDISSTPTHPSAGYFVHIPDGGILPTPFPVTHVVDGSGAELKSYALWQNRDTGMGVVFEKPTQRDVYVYVTGGSQLELWRPASGLTPSPILCADPDRGDVKGGRALARLGQVGPGINYAPNPGHPRAPLSIGGDQSGRPPPCSFYLLAYLVTSDPGRTWVAPIPIRGQSEISIDGRPVAPTKRIDKWGGTGNWVNLTAGLHRFEAFSGCSGTASFAEGRGVLWMAWTPPGTTIDDLGGKRPIGEPFAGTSAWASRVIAYDEIVRSGTARVRDVQARDDSPIACAVLQDTHTFWFEGETPVVIYSLRALTAGNPKGTEYTWDFGNNVQLAREKASWLFPGNAECSVTLKVAAGGRESRCVRRFYAYSMRKTSLNDPVAREAFRSTCLGVMEAHPPDADPTEGWDAGMWNNLFRNLELGKGAALIAHIFTKRWDKIEKKISPERKVELEDQFLMLAPSIDAASAVKWAERFKKNVDRRRQDEMTLREAEFHAYYLDDLETARARVLPLARGVGPLAALAKIRLADIEFLAGNVNEATQLYGEVQNAAKREVNVLKTERPRLLSRLARNRKELEEERAARRQPLKPRAPSTPVTTTDEWEINAIREVCASETVKSLIEQKYYQEARDALDLWERLFPLSKVSGDYMVLEARFFMALGHYGRARRLLEAYCEQVDASSFIPDAVQMLLECMMQMRESDATLKEFCEAMKKRLEFHPVANKIDSMLRVLNDEGGARESTRDR